MSRVGESPIAVPDGVTIKLKDSEVKVKGPGGELAYSMPGGMRISLEGKYLKLTRPDDSKNNKALHGLARALVANMVTGVSKGFEKVLDIQGVGYKAQKTAEGVILQVGYSHTLNFVAPSGITLDVEGTNRVKVRGISKEMVGEIAARIRALRPPDRYKGKGIRYLGEMVQLKPGKAGKTAGKKT